MFYADSPFGESVHEHTTDCVRFKPDGSTTYLDMLRITAENRFVRWQAPGTPVIENLDSCAPGYHLLRIPAGDWPVDHWRLQYNNDPNTTTAVLFPVSDFPIVNFWIRILVDHYQVFCWENQAPEVICTTADELMTIFARRYLQSPGTTWFLNSLWDLVNSCLVYLKPKKPSLEGTWEPGWAHWRAAIAYFGKAPSLGRFDLFMMAHRNKSHIAPEDTSPMLHWIASMDVVAHSFDQHFNMYKPTEAEIVAIDSLQDLDDMATYPPFLTGPEVDPSTILAPFLRSPTPELSPESVRLLEDLFSWKPKEGPSWADELEEYYEENPPLWYANETEIVKALIASPALDEKDGSIPHPRNQGQAGLTKREHLRLAKVARPDMPISWALKHICPKKTHDQQRKIRWPHTAGLVKLWDQVKERYLRGETRFAGRAFQGWPDAPGGHKKVKGNSDAKPGPSNEDRKTRYSPDNLARRSKGALRPDNQAMQKAIAELEIELAAAKGKRKTRLQIKLQRLQQDLKLERPAKLSTRRGKSSKLQDITDAEWYALGHD